MGADDKSHAELVMTSPSSSICIGNCIRLGDLTEQQYSKNIQRKNHQPWSHDKHHLETGDREWGQFSYYLEGGSFLESYETQCLTGKFQEDNFE